MDDALKLKKSGNDSFKEGKYSKALETYQEALASLIEAKEGDDGSVDKNETIDQLSKRLGSVSIERENSEKKDLIISLLSNIAAVLLKQNKFESCMAYCDLTLSLDPESSKALYRKIQALYKLGRLANAANLCKSLLSKDPSNNEAQKLMMQLKTEIDNKNSLTNKALEMIDEIVTDVDANVQLDNSTKVKYDNHLKQLLGSVIDDPMLAKAICLRDATSKLWNIRKSFPFGVRILRKLVDYSDCQVFVLRTVDISEIYNLLKSAAENNLEEIGYSGDELGAMLQTVIHLYSNKSLGVVHSDDFSKVFGNPIEEADKDFETTCLKMCINGLTTDDTQLRKYSIESLVRFLANNKELAQKFVKECNGLNSLLLMLTPKKKSAAEGEKESEEEALKALRVTIQQVAIILGRVLPSLKDDEIIKSYGTGFTIPALKSDDIFDQMKGCAALVAVLIANLELGVALVTESEGKILELLLDLAQKAPAKTQGLICEIFANMANSETGRETLKGDEKFTVTLNVLVHSDTINVRTNAAVTLAKLNATKFEQGSEQGMVVLSSVFNLLQEKTTEEEKAKGVEAVSYVATDRDVKMMLCETEKGIGLLKTLTKLAAEDKSVATSPYAFGLAHIFENLTMSEDDKRREKLREMEVTQEQWEQFQKLTKTEQAGQKRDPPENVQKRIKAFIKHNGAAAMRSLVLNGGSERVRESVAKTYCNCGVVVEVRGLMFSQGAARALINLVSEKPEVDVSEKPKSKFQERERRTRLSTTTKLAAHALAKMFITTDPNLVGFNVVMDSLKCLVDNLKHCSDEDLIIFETCMALTNLGTVSQDAKRRIIGLNAIQHLEYVTYNEDLLVRRSACECLCNLVPEKEMLDWFCSGNHMKLWLMFAGAYEEDLKTSEACLGALAGVCYEAEIAKAIESEEKGIPTLVVILMSQQPSLIHRVAVCFLGLLQSLEESREKLKAFKLEDAISEAQATPELPEGIIGVLDALKEGLKAPPATESS